MPRFNLPAGLDRDRIFEDKWQNLSNFSDRIVRTAKMVAVGTGTGNKKIAEALLATAGQVNPTSRMFCTIFSEENHFLLSRIL
jgi:hypothetical protein